MKKVYFTVLIAVVNFVVVGSVIPNMVSSNHTELVFGAILVALVLVHANVIAWRKLLKK